MVRLQKALYEPVKFEKPLRSNFDEFLPFFFAILFYFSGTGNCAMRRSIVSVPDSDFYLLSLTVCWQFLFTRENVVDLKGIPKNRGCA